MFLGEGGSGTRGHPACMVRSGRALTVGKRLWWKSSILNLHQHMTIKTGPLNPPSAGHAPHLGEDFPKWLRVASVLRWACGAWGLTRISLGRRPRGLYVWLMDRATRGRNPATIPFVRPCPLAAEPPLPQGIFPRAPSGSGCLSLTCTCATHGDPGGLRGGRKTSWEASEFHCPLRPFFPLKLPSAAGEWLSSLPPTWTGHLQTPPPPHAGRNPDSVCLSFQH